MAESGDSSHLHTVQGEIKPGSEKLNEGGSDSHDHDSSQKGSIEERERSKQEEREKVKQEDFQDGVQDDKLDNNEPSETKEMTKKTEETVSKTKEHGDGAQSHPKIATKVDERVNRNLQRSEGSIEDREKSKLEEREKVKQEDVQDGGQDDKWDNNEHSEKKEMTKKSEDTDSKTKEHRDGAQSHPNIATKVDERVNEYLHRSEGLYKEEEEANKEKAHVEQDEKQDDIQHVQQDDKKKDIETNKRKEEMHRWILYGLAALGVLFALIYMSPYSTPPVQKEMNVVEAFTERMEKVKSSFLNQRPELWKRSRIHISRHLKTVNPTEPVSLILTSGYGAERTLGCLARRLAEAFSNALNSSVLDIDGKSKASEDSDKVKLDIDSDLRKSFGGKMLAAVIHRFEELPPGSTLIFYRYCDHENAAYKKVFMVFTVMLDSEEEVPSNLSLARVEDMVHEQIKRKFVSSDKSALFNQMDVDKLSGLWSRISHLILPVTGEEMIEQQGCEA